jgi:uncharacterized protein YjiS (DUF1127 family)
MSFVTPDVLTLYQAPSRPSSHRPSGMTAWFSRLIQTWRVRIRERDALARLDDRDLRDIGLSRWEIELELAKPFWRS